MLIQICIFLSVISGLYACKGCISLDEYNIDKIIPKFEAVLVKFDVAFPYGEKHDVFVAFADENYKNPDLIFADVGVKDYGERDNEKLAEKYQINAKDDLPAVLLFKGDAAKPIVFNNAHKLNLANLRDFIRNNTDLYIGLPGCVEKYDFLAAEFIKLEPNQEIHTNIINEINKETHPAAETYAKYMKKIMEVGNDFIDLEMVRLNKIIQDSNLNAEKKKNLKLNLNVLKSFKRRDEL